MGLFVLFWFNYLEAFEGWEVEDFYTVYARNLNGIVCGVREEGRWLVIVFN